MPALLPLKPSEFNYRFSSVIEQREFLFDIRWNARDGAWYMAILDLDETPIASGIKLVLGNLFSTRLSDERRPSGMLWLTDTSGTGQDADFDDMGVRVLLYHFTKEEAETLLFV